MLDRIQFKGAPGSPYTRKMLALLRYRHIPYAFLVAEDMVPREMPEPKVSLLPTFYLPNASGEIEAVVDSTPLIRRLEQEFTGRNVVPANPVIAFINYLLEDFADEWLTKAMFHYRWYYAADIEQGGVVLPLWRNYQIPPDSHTKIAAYIRERQISRLYVVGSNDTTAPLIEASYKRLLGILDKLLQTSPFIIGNRPGSADFAFYGQLTQLAGFDPTPMQLCLDLAPRVYAWTDIMDDLTGLNPKDDDWLDLAAVPQLNALFQEIGLMYTPVMIANAAAASQGNSSFQCNIAGKPWQQPTFPYQVKCLQWMREAFADLDNNQQTQVQQLFAGSGCEPLLTN